MRHIKFFFRIFYAPKSIIIFRTVTTARRNVNKFYVDVGNKHLRVTDMNKFHVTSQPLEGCTDVHKYEERYEK